MAFYGKDDPFIKHAKDQEAQIKEQEEKFKLLCAHIRTALTTPSGAILRQWLKEACCMTAETTLDVLNEPFLIGQINAKRDIYIQLEELLVKGLEYGRSSTDAVDTVHQYTNTNTNTAADTS